VATETILVVEDESDIRDLIVYNLERAGYEAVGVGAGAEALQRVSARRPDAIILDLMMPGIDGMEVCRRLKHDETTRGIPVVMLTARGEDGDIVAGLESGADDYVTKPFSTKVLLARLRAVLRRRGARVADTPQRFEVHGVTVDTAKHEVYCRGVMVALSATEFSILEFLMRSPGWVFSRAKIIDAVKGSDYPVTERSVDVQILGLRKKLDDCGELIETVRGVGYRYRGP
jgi:two-component system, OmpR family, alkaline phosphatase synthesis response regulator PhoP